ncbi:GNAT family N-acetyltransferase [Glycomyces albidus]|uniref:GNAT family N-acetyltransferase n=1 Tax=Glycomyces albidus TaxID=2656774 RepID=A0A6L5G2R6_9ACTN|nr:N-acetyltransferase [Glycomyces albidus]MQM24107.1 GNAT family N-acetyltransferase [Glycomyces albidus]
MTLIRRETDGDREAVHALQEAAFAAAVHASGHEADLVDALRGTDRWAPQYSLVAEIDGKVAGHVVSSYGRLNGEPVLGLGPIGVDPARHGQGIGSDLMHAAIAAADARDEPAILLLGDPGFYGRFGFVPAADHGVESEHPEWGYYFQIRTLAAWRPDLRGVYSYAPAFDRFG